MRAFGLPPYLEISSKGDNPLLNAYYVRVAKFNNRTIEEVMQATKIFQDGSTGLSVKDAQTRFKQHIPVINEVDVIQVCFDLWQTHLLSSVKAKELIVNCTGISDKYATGSSKYNVETLWRLRAKFLQMKSSDIEMEMCPSGSSAVVRKSPVTSIHNVATTPSKGEQNA